MILFNSFIAFYVIFITPQIIFYYKFKYRYSLVISYGLILSFTIIWGLFLINYYLKIPNIYLYILFVISFIYSLVYLFSQIDNDKSRYIIWLLSISVLLPLFTLLGDGFTDWDAVVSWNRWAIEISENRYAPSGSAYPVLIPSALSIFYKIQGSVDIWWTAKILLFILPLFMVAILFSLYNESKNKTYLLILILIYPYLIWNDTVNGYVDMPVMLFGLLSLILLYASEQNKDNENFDLYIYASLLIAGIAAITKQAGLVFLIFNIVYIFLNYKYLKSKIKILAITVFSISYFMSFLTIFYKTSKNTTSNLDYLENLSYIRAFKNKTFEEIYLYLVNNFFNFPNGLLLFGIILSTIGIFLFILKDTRKYNSVSFLSIVFFFIGTYLWVKYFSYDYRNSLWVKSFIIMTIAININILFVKYFNRFLPKINILNLNITFKQKHYILIVAIILIVLVNLGNSFAYKIQEKSQKKIGDVKTAKQISKLLMNKSECLRVYTSRQKLRYNYYANNVKSRISSAGWNTSQLIGFFDHDCVEGRYFSFGWWNTQTNGWKKVKELEKNGQIQKVNDNWIYFVPPNYNKKDALNEQ
jgi:hypothetical protein